MNSLKTIVISSILLVLSTATFAEGALSEGEGGHALVPATAQAQLTVTCPQFHEGEGQGEG